MTDPDHPFSLNIKGKYDIVITIKVLNIGTDRSEQTVQTQIRLLLKEQSDQGIHCLPFHLHVFDILLHSISKHPLPGQLQ